MDLDIKTLSLLFMGAAVLLIVFSFKRGKHPGQDESLKGLTSKLARSQNVTIPLDRIARLSWLKGEGDLYVEDMELAKELYSYPEDKARKSRGLFKAQTGFAYPASGVDNEQTPACIREFHAHKNEVTSAFFEEVIRPFLPKLIQNDTLDIIMKILTFLSTEGDIPSVVSADRQNKDLGYTYTFLKQVSLAQHSINTAKIGMDILRNEFLFYYDITPDKYLTLFLGHDLGKTAPSKNYSLQDHPILSAQILSSLIPDSVSWKEEALETVKNHHMSAKLDQPHETPEKSDLWLLQTADRKAREMEIQSVSAQIGNPTESWGVQPEGWQTTGPDSPQPEAAQDNETLQSGRQPADQRGVPTPLDASYPHKHDESPAPPAGTNQVRPACQTGRGQAAGQAPPEIGGQAPPEVGGQVSNTKQQRLKGLLNSLKTVRMQLFIEWKKRFAGVFARAQAKYEKEGRAILEEKLLQCIDRCQCGQEQTFAGYFLKYALRGFSEIEDDRMASGFSMPRKKKLLYRRLRRSIQDTNSNRHRDLVDTMNEDIDVIIGVMEAPLHRSSYTDTCLAVHETPETILEAKEAATQHLNLRADPPHDEQTDPEIKFWWDLPIRHL